MKHHKALIRRTFLQERFEILIKKQKNGSATFSELTELDDIVNRDPDIRFSILEEIQGTDTPTNDPPKEEIILIQPAISPNMLEKLRTFLSGLFRFASPGAVHGMVILS